MIEPLAAVMGPAALAATPYVAWWKLLVLLVLAVPWLAACPWVYQDARSPKVRAPQYVWSGTVLAVGTLGLAIWLLVPSYPVGLLVFVVLALAALGAYVVYRNQRVENEADKILTAQHMAAFFSPTGAKRKGAEVQTRVKVYGPGNTVVPAPDPSSAELDEIHAYNLVQELFYDVIWRRASNTDVSPASQQGVRVRMMVDGVVQERQQMDSSEAERLIQYVKRISGMDPEERRRPQEGTVTIEPPGNDAVDLLVSVAGTTGGQRMQIKAVQQLIQTRIEQLGMSEETLSRVREIAGRGQGLIIVSGRPGNGVTSTLYSLLRDQDAYIKHLMTVESEKEVELENVTQHIYGDESKLPDRLAAALRRDPDVIMVDRATTSESAAGVLDAAEEKLVLLGMNAPDSFTALAKWLKVSGGGSEAIENLQAVLCQVLLRKLCEACKEAYRPDPQMLAKANLPSKKISSFYRPPTEPLTDEKGNPVTCQNCQGSGYRGRTAVFELLEVTDEIRRLLAANASLTQIKAACRKSKMLYLQEQALRKVMEGVTSVQEVLRVSQQPKKKQK